MGYNRDKSGIDNTCPKIDHAIALTEELATMIEEGGIGAELAEFNQIMEQIRTANEELRKWGNEEYERAEEAESEVSSLKDRVNELESENDTLSSEVESLNEELNSI